MIDGWSCLGPAWATDITHATEVAGAGSALLVHASRAHVTRGSQRPRPPTATIVLCRLWF
eukprot:454606-Prymnesium_polylepis.1